MTEIRYLVLVKGEVQRGGFRSFVKKRALLHGVTGYAENLSTGEVVLVLEGEEENLETLLTSIEEEAPAYIEVENVEKRREEYRGAFDDFERKGADVVEGLEEGTREILLRIASTSKSTDEKLEKGIEHLSDIKSDTSAIKEDTSAIKKDTSAIKEDTSAIKGDTSAISEKQDETIQTIREEASKTRETIDEEASKARTTLEEGFTEQRKAHVETRELSKEVFYAEVEELRNEIRDLRSTVDDIQNEIGLA